MTLQDGSITPAFPRKPGTYALVLTLPEDKSIQVGKLGRFDFPAGTYIYVGSAFGSGGLAGRLNRHLRPVTERRVHWHIDYLAAAASVQAIWFAEQFTDHETRREHDWAALVGQLKGATIPAPRFGASDCRCPAHLFHLPQEPDWNTFQQMLFDRPPCDRPLARRNLSASPPELDSEHPFTNN
jgi:Uri superfamily endonuclease